MCYVCVKKDKGPLYDSYLQHFTVAHGVPRMQDFMPLYDQRQRALQSISVELAEQVQTRGHTLIGPCLPLRILLQAMVVHHTGVIERGRQTWHTFSAQPCRPGMHALTSTCAQQMLTVQQTQQMPPSV